MPSIRRLGQQGSAVVLASFLVVSSSRAAASKPSARELAKRWRERQPMRIDELRRTWLERRGAASWAELRRQRLAARRGEPAKLAPRFHAGGLVVPEPKPINPLLDPLGIFEGEAGEESPVGPVARLFLADFDGDGDLDAFVGDKYGYVRYLRNEAGPGKHPVYVELTGAASPTGALDLSRDGDGGFPFGPSAPTLVDIDGDGDLDLFVGQGYDDEPGDGGRVLFFENVGGTLVRNDAENPFAGFVFGELGAAPTFVDIDGDGDFDAFVGTKIVALSPDGGEVFFLRNTGDANNPVFADETNTASDPFAGEEFLPSTAPYFADIDGDGDPDAFVGNAFWTRFFRNDTVVPGTPVFTEDTGYTNPLAGSLLAAPGPVLADVDGDGDLDAFVTGGYYGKVGYYLGIVQYFENTGTALDSSFLSTGDRIELVDVDGDGDLDALVSSLGNPLVEVAGLAARAGAPALAPRAAVDPALPGVWYFRNLGTDAEPVWELQCAADNPFFTFNSTVGSLFDGSSFFPSFAPTVGDLDGDGLLEAFVGLPDGTLEYLEDDGTGQLDPAASHPLELIDFGETADPHLADVNGDGELDLVVGYDYYNEDDETLKSKVAIFLNPLGPAGLVAPPDLVLDFTGQIVRPAPTLADVDGDGDLDLLVGGYYYVEDCACEGPSSYGYSLTLFVENTGTPAAPAFDPLTAVPVQALVQGPTSPAMGDVNGDGLLDLFIGNPGGVEMFLTAVPELEVTKQITGGDLQHGGTVEYTVTVTNVGTGATADDPDDPELIDTLPPELTLVSAVVASGPGSVSTSGNTVRWDGALDPGESVAIVITADIAPDILGQTIENQAVAFFDTDEDGDNDTEEPSDDLTTAPVNDPTAFVVGAQSILEIPTLSQWGTMLFASLLSLLGLLGL
ncbi:MAG TPA: FG-GAP-like repeat-containing protein, partial [Thermoanaerobaculia bacterium]|nr:FG-GAP-like repeat-containing protein [Thermoanaerobaculia bacterium]